MEWGIFQCCLNLMHESLQGELVNWKSDLNYQKKTKTLASIICLEISSWMSGKSYSLNDAFLHLFNSRKHVAVQFLKRKGLLRRTGMDFSQSFQLFKSLCLTPFLSL